MFVAAGETTTTRRQQREAELEETGGLRGRRKKREEEAPFPLPPQQVLSSLNLDMLSLPELCHDLVYSFLDAKAVCNLMACNQWLLDYYGSIVEEIVLRNRNNDQEGQQHIASLLRRRPRLVKITTMDVSAFEGVVASMMLGPITRGRLHLLGYPVTRPIMPSSCHWLCS